MDFSKHVKTIVETVAILVIFGPFEVLEAQRWSNVSKDSMDLHGFPGVVFVEGCVSSRLDHSLEIFRSLGRLS